MFPEKSCLLSRALADMSCLPYGKQGKKLGQNCMFHFPVCLRHDVSHITEIPSWRPILGVWVGLGETGSSPHCCLDTPSCPQRGGHCEGATRSS